MKLYLPWAIVRHRTGVAIKSMEPQSTGAPGKHGERKTVCWLSTLGNNVDGHIKEELAQYIIDAVTAYNTPAIPSDSVMIPPGEWKRVAMSHKIACDFGGGWGLVWEALTAAILRKPVKVVNKTITISFDSKNSNLEPMFVSAPFVGAET